MPPPISNCTLSKDLCWKDGAALAAVLGTKGVERHAITFHGQEAHSGSTPMTARRDALAAAAKLALEIGRSPCIIADAVCTMGSVKTFQAS
jgi:N-carbamoyl-L-amino-acid hydrolase